MMLLLQIALFASLASVVSAYDNGVFRLPYMGWSTWCTNANNSLIPCYDDFCNEAEIRDVANFMASNGLTALGYTTILLDDCWAGTMRSASGEIQADTTRFPSGTLQPLAQYLHSLNMTLGAYTDIGPKTCRDGRLGSWPHYAQDASTFAKWGLDLIKVDWCAHPSQFTQQQLYTNFSNALNQTGHAFGFNICGWGLNDVWTWGGSIATSARIGPDHLPLWWMPPTNQDPGQSGGTANIIQHMAGKSKYYGPYNFPDPDFLEPGYWWNGEQLDRVEFSFWCLFSAPLMVATDVRVLNNKKHILNTEAIAINQDPLVIPGDLVTPNTTTAQVWTKQLINNRWAVILYNAELFGVSTQTPTLQFSGSMLSGWPAGKISAHVRDIWAHKDIGVFYGSFGKALSPRDAVMLIITPN